MSDLITRELVLKDGGRCAIGGDHEHPNVAVCFDHGHTLHRVDDYSSSPMSATARFQHGDNPEHSILVPLMVTCDDRCTGFEVDEWVSAIHARRQSESNGGTE